MKTDAELEKDRIKDCRTCSHYHLSPIGRGECNPRYNNYCKNKGYGDEE